MISGTAISDTTSCDIRTPDITSDIDSDIGGVVLWYHRFWTLLSQHLSGSYHNYWKYETFHHVNLMIFNNFFCASFFSLSFTTGFLHLEIIAQFLFLSSTTVFLNLEIFAQVFFLSFTTGFFTPRNYCLSFFFYHLQRFFLHLEIFAQVFFSIIYNGFFL